MHQVKFMSERSIRGLLDTQLTRTPAPSWSPKLRYRFGAVAGQAVLSAAVMRLMANGKWLRWQSVALGFP